ncbi:MAG: hypothetical protein ABJ370_14590 [Paracoccaceae bacterium]
MFIQRYLISFAFLGAMGGTAVTAETTPNEVFQRTETVLAMLGKMNESNFTTVPPQSGTGEPALPRHVLQTGRDVWRKMQLLRFMNGLPTKSMPELEVKTISPGVVKSFVDALYVEAEALLPAYGIMDAQQDTSLPSGKTPSDVLNSLKQVSASLDSLGIPATVPNDVFQLAETVRNDMVSLAEGIGLSNVENVMSQVPLSEGRSPADAYDASIDLLQDIKALTEMSAQYAAKGGIDVPQKRPQSITPTDVIRVLGRARADINAVKVKAGARKAGRSAPYTGGRTPSDVHRSIEQARAVVSLIITQHKS